MQAFGLNGDGQLGIDSTKDVAKPIVVKLGTAIATQVACGGVHSLVRINDGRVLGFGKNWCGICVTNHGFCIKDAGFCIENHGFCVISMMDFV